LLNGGKESVALDFHDPALQKLVADADVVIESSRPRALQQFGIGPSADQVWLSITAYGRHSNGVGFGDDAAVAGGLVVWDEAGPCFCVDAVADPLTGLTAAELCLAALEDGRQGLIDVPLAGVADGAAIAGALRAADASLPAGVWLRAVGWHGPQLDRVALDAAVPERPVRVQHRSGALWVLNTRALDAVGLDAPDGRLFRMDDVLRTRVPPEATPDVAAVGRCLASYGLTGVTDATPTDRPTDIALLER